MATLWTVTFRIFTIPNRGNLQNAYRNVKNGAPALLLSRGLKTQNITSSLRYITKEDNLDLTIDKNTLKFKSPLPRPMCIMLSWLLPKDKHLMKYADIYLDLGFDVTTVICTPWQTMWPTGGSQVVAADLIKFLEANEEQQPLVVHGFSVGAYLWAELLVHALKDIERYQPVLDRVSAQVWDSPADVEDLPVGFSKALFPHNVYMQKILTTSMKTHMSVFHSVATRHYIRASHAYSHTPCAAPALFLVSKSDPIGNEHRSTRTKGVMTERGMKCTLKCWESSPHVQHYTKHPEEYLEAVYTHLEETGLLRRQPTRKTMTN